MEEYQDFKLLAHAALSKFNVTIGTFYGSRDTALASGEDLWRVSVNGQGLPATGFSVGCATPTAAVDTMVRRLKEHQRQAAAERDARDRARRTQPEALEA
jgi:uncharacterized lipoprotein YmbA